MSASFDRRLTLDSDQPTDGAVDPSAQDSVVKSEWQILYHQHPNVFTPCCANTSLSKATSKALDLEQV